MTILFYTAVFILGLVAGSFLNVCIFRLPGKKSLIRPGSFCPFCEAPIKPYDNIPVLSFVILGGKCRNCREKISFRYPAVELLTGLLMLLLAYNTIKTGRSAAVFGVYTYLTLGLIVVTGVDIAHEIIPDEISLAGIPVGIALSIIIPSLHADVPLLWEGFSSLSPRIYSLISSLAGMIVGGGTLWLIGAVAGRLLKKDAMGFGDVKLMAMVGSVMGWVDVLIIFFLASGIGSIVGIIVMIRTKSRRIPFGPFLSIATYLMMIWGPGIIVFITDTYPAFIQQTVSGG